MITREDRIASIRQLADLLEQNPDVPLPYGLNGIGDLLFFATTSERPKDDMVAFVRMLPGNATKGTGGADGHMFKVSGQIGTIEVSALAEREAVCERVVVGTREVVEQVPDPDVVAAAPIVTVTKTVEDVQWVCGSLLAGTDPQAAYSERLTVLEPAGIPAKAEVSA